MPTNKKNKGKKKAKRNASVKAKSSVNAKDDERLVERRDEQLPDGWIRKLDEESGEHYYYDCFMKKSQWERPQTPKNPPCYHGSTADKFDINGDYMKVTFEWDEILWNSITTREKLREFYSRNAKFMGDKEFVRFIFALATQECLRPDSHPKKWRHGSCIRLVQLGCLVEAWVEAWPASEKYRSSLAGNYHVDIVILKKLGNVDTEKIEKFLMGDYQLGTKVGLLYCLAKHTPCKCAKNLASSLPKTKTGTCHTCGKYLHLREKPRLDGAYWCTGCSCVHYCSKSCQKKDWGNGHENLCKTIQKLLAM